MEQPINIHFVQLAQFAALLFTGLVAGLFYGYDCSVIKGIGNLPDDVYLRSFQSINKAIQNPYFFISFMGSLLLLPLLCWLNYKQYSPAAFYLILLATLIYVTGVFGVTIFGNVPLNERLAKFIISTGTSSEITIARKAFEKNWNTYHTIRTMAAIISFSLVILSCLKINTGR